MLSCTGGITMEWVYVRSVPVDAQYMYYKAKEASERGEFLQALDFLKGAVTIAPRYEKAFYEMGNCLDELGRFDEAIEMYKKTIEIDPFFMDAWVKKDQILKKTGRETSGIFAMAGGS
jgi:tetratricopeptide (TPR) repeat protein